MDLFHVCVRYVCRSRLGTFLLVVLTVSYYGEIVQEIQMIVNHSKQHPHQRYKIRVKKYLKFFYYL